MAATELRVLMLGPALDAPGGVAVVARRLLESPPDGVVLEHLATSSPAGRRQKLLAAAGAAAQLPALIRSFRPHVAHVHLGGGASLPRKLALTAVLRAAGVPVVTHCHFPGADGLATRGPRRGMLRALARAPACVVVLSAAQQELLEPLAPGRVLRVPNGVPVDRFLPLGPAGGPPTILYLGGAEERKGWRDLRAALETLPDRPWRARLAGPGAQTLAAAFEPWPQVELLGLLDEAATLEALQDADIFVLPSRAEGLPLALLEAMSCGLACVATRTDGMRDAIDPGRTGLLVPPRDPAALSAAIGELLVDPHLRNRLGRGARQAAVEHFDERIAGRRLGEAWRRAAGQPGAGA